MRLLCCVTVGSISRAAEMAFGVGSLFNGHHQHAVGLRWPRKQTGVLYGVFEQSDEHLRVVRATFVLDS